MSLFFATNSTPIVGKFKLSSKMWQKYGNGGRAEVGRKDSGRGEARNTKRKTARTSVLWTDLGPGLQWTLKDCRRECACLKDLGRFGAMAVDGQIPAVYNRKSFERDPILI